jgi:mono/diheme cytochrome c family protein
MAKPPRESKTARPSQPRRRQDRRPEPLLTRVPAANLAKYREVLRRRGLLEEESSGGQSKPAAGRGFLPFAIVAGIAVAAGIMAFERYAATRATGIDWKNPQQITLGKSLYRQHCAFCHGAFLEGQEGWDDEAVLPRPAPPLDESGPAAKRTDRQLFDFVKLGGQPFLPPGQRSLMPAYEFNLTDAQIWAIVAYTKDRWPDEVQASQATIDKASGANK